MENFFVNKAHLWKGSEEGAASALSDIAAALKERRCSHGGIAEEESSNSLHSQGEGKYYRCQLHQKPLKPNTEPEPSKSIHRSSAMTLFSSFLMEKLILPLCFVC